MNKTKKNMWFEMEMRCTSETLLDDVVSPNRRKGDVH